MLRTVKYLSLLVVQFIGALLGVGALFIAFYAVSTPLSEFESAGWRIPVSYTHLRAHETRHDLVCRLLLEKKKRRV